MTDVSLSRLPRAVLQIALVIGFVALLHFGKGLLLPLVVAGLLAALLDPVHEKLMAWGLPSGLAIAVCLLILLTVFGGLFTAIGQQASAFSDNWPETQEKLTREISSLRTNYGLEGIIPETKGKTLTGDGDEEGIMDQLPTGDTSILGFITATFGVLGDFMLTLIYIILLLTQKQRLREFFLRLMPDEHRGTTHQTMNESRDVVQKYLRGYLIVIAVLAVLYSVGFLISGLEYAILIAALAASLSIIPYLGNIIAGLFAIALAYSSGGETSAVFGVVITMSLAQVLESYVLTPLVVGDEVSLNPLATIICVVGMGYLWGPVGAIVGIPLFAILRIVCSHVKGMEPYAYLLGHEK